MNWWAWTPPVASTFADKVDTIYGALWGMTAFFVGLIMLLITIFMIKYRRSKRPETPPKTVTNMKLEIAWCFIPLIGGLTFFVWGAVVYLEMYSSAPPNSYEVYVTGKQWMWKFQHPNGLREINELHIPEGQPVKLVMISQDVIHSFDVPAFRIKHDVLPMMYTQAWFSATQVGTYHIFCAEYCGTLHAGMGGRVIVMNQRDFGLWQVAAPTQGSPASEGETLLVDLGCRACHAKDRSGLAPQLEGIMGEPVELEDGTTVTVDENYIRESILNPSAQIVANYQPVMPPYAGRITEEQILAIIAYLKSPGAQQ